jgi:hypothetical protein
MMGISAMLLVWACATRMPYCTMCCHVQPSRRLSLQCVGPLFALSSNNAECVMQMAMSLQW